MTKWPVIKPQPRGTSGRKPGEEQPIKKGEFQGTVKDLRGGGSARALEDRLSGKQDEEDENE